MAVTRRHVLAGSVAMGAAAATNGAARAAGAVPRVERWGVHEIVLHGPATGNPFVEAQVAATFRQGATEIVVPGFYDGDGVFRIRFSPPTPGRWSWTTQGNAAGLTGAQGAFDCIAPGKGNHGPVRVTSDGYHFVHADGTPFCQIGTTCYSWALQSEARCAETLATLARAPFNKMRMCVFPNVASVVTDPFVRTGPGLRDWDPARFDPAFFRRFEDRIRRLDALGIQADIILYHPYDAKRGYSDMTRADDERYLRYVAARFGAYRNVWWAMANEYDLVKSKSVADWDHLFRVLQAADPHDRLRSIHNIHAYYDNRKPWITHASIQNGAAVTGDIPAQLHRSFAEKAVIFDEVCYEGDIDARWGRLSGEQMVSRFWWATIGGTYAGHSETFAPGRQADGSWLGQGGRLMGSSAPRLAFLRRILEEGPLPGIEPIQTWWEYHIAGKPHEYYLHYFGEARPTQWPVIVPGKPGEPLHRYRAEIIDTWNMTVTAVDGTFAMAQANGYDQQDPARPTLTLPGTPWLAARLRRA